MDDYIDEILDSQEEYYEDDDLDTDFIAS